MEWPPGGGSCGSSLGWGLSVLERALNKRFLQFYGCWWREKRRGREKSEGEGEGGVGGWGVVNYWVFSQSGKTGLQGFLPHPTPGRGSWRPCIKRPRNESPWLGKQVNKECGQRGWSPWLHLPSEAALRWLPPGRCGEVSFPLWGLPGPLELPVVGPQKSHLLFKPGARLLNVIYVFIIFLL